MRGDKVGTKNFANLKLGVLKAAKIGRNWNLFLKSGLWILGRPYNTPGPDPETYNLPNISLEKNLYPWVYGGSY